MVTFPTKLSCPCVQISDIYNNIFRKIYFLFQKHVRTLLIVTKFDSAAFVICCCVTVTLKKGVARLIKALAIYVIFYICAFPCWPSKTVAEILPSQFSSSSHNDVVPARTSLTLHPPSPPTVHQLSRLAL